MDSFVDLSRPEGLFGRTLFYRYELPPSFPPQTLIIIFYEQDPKELIEKSMMMMIMIFFWPLR